MAFGDIEQPTWLDEPCPAWCMGVHRESDHPDDRQHQSEGFVLPAIFFRGIGAGVLDSEAAELVVTVSRAVHQPETYVFIGEAEGPEQFLKISLETARRLKTTLDTALELIKAA